MGSIGEKVSSWWSNLTGSTPQQTAAPIQDLAPVATTPAGPAAIGMGREKKGYTSAGGKRHASRKSRSASKRGGKRGKTARKH